MKTCSKCQTVCEDSMKFCLNCGAPFKSAEAEIADALASSAVPVEPVNEINVDDIKIKEYVPTPEPAQAPPVIDIPEPKMPFYDEEEEDDEDDEDYYDDDDDDDYDDDDYYEDDGVKKPISPLSVIALICAIIGLFSSGYGAVLSFVNLGISIAFFVPSILGIIFGIIAASVTGRGHKRSGKAMAVISVILSIVGIIFWIVCIFIVKGQTKSLYGASDIISVVRLIVEK